MWLQAELEDHERLPSLNRIFRSCLRLNVLSRALVFRFALCIPCLLYVFCLILFPLCIVFPCLYQCTIYCHRVNIQLQ
jgi:hypothetical protein